MELTATSLESELSTDKLRLAGKKFQEAFRSHRLVEHVIQDLEKYHKALSYAITKFHQERMDVINRIVRELWRQTYKGNDIDFIEVKTDDVDPNADMDARRNCNYRVVMRKGHAELEMRGRCSAGQRVLASLIIRLALAQTFSSECGIIALDEPTTNLVSRVHSRYMVLVNTANKNVARVDAKYCSCVRPCSIVFAGSREHRLPR